MNIYINIILTTFLYDSTFGILYPRPSETREVLPLDGLWRFSLSPNGTFNDGDSLTGDESDKDVHLMPVPSSYNDILTTLNGRDHLGPVKYERSFFIQKSWINDERRIWIRFGSVCYSAEVYINGELVVTHSIGHLPFEADITSVIVPGNNIITVNVDNTLTSTTVPQGGNQTLPSGRIKQTYKYDFFNYAGIDRSVYLYTTPKVYINDVTVTTTISNTIGIVQFIVETNGTDLDYQNMSLYVSALNKEEEEVSSLTLTNIDQIYEGTLEIENAELWWPYLMNDNPGYLYTLNIEVSVNNTLLDKYQQPFGVRELAWDNNSFLINGKSIYFRGLGRHEDSDIRGKGVDLPLIVRDHNLLRWMGVNSYRTSHYPYAEEIMDLADSLGIMILDECPIVNSDNYNDELLENHKRSLTELYQRDKNRPSVVMWSIANEPNTKAEESKDYYNHIAAHIKSFDKTRPISLAMYYDAGDDYAGEFLDIICFNKYEGWYLYPGDADVIISNIIKVAKGWRNKYNKLVMITEYGADSLEGLHILPSYMWSEEYQLDVMSNYFQAFDDLRNRGWFIGEMIWNFADFKTANDVRRVGGNKKGVFTRQRQPKAAAHFLRRRYWHLAHLLENATLPLDLNRYLIENEPLVKDEL